MDNDGPYYDDFKHGMTIPPLPAVTVTEADNVAYRMITGDQHFASADQDTYRRVSGSSNALVNLSSLITIPNNILQGEFKTAGVNTGRFVINTTVGILGIFNVAKKMGFS